MRTMTLMMKIGCNFEKKENKNMKNFMNYEEAKKIVHSIGVKSRIEWMQFTKSEEFKNMNLPSLPEMVYKTDGWVSWGDFLGTATPAQQKRTFLSYGEAKAQLGKMKLNSVSEWQSYTRSEQFDNNLPKNPSALYKNDGWVSWKDFLGASE